jgi:hypothetical protein
MRKVCAKMVPKELTKEHSVREFLAIKHITVLKHPLLHPEMKEILKGKYFDDNDDIGVI